MSNLNEILKNVQKPGRYIGCEINSVRKDHAGKVSVVLGYPDTYEVGMSYLGLRILYHLLNDMDDVVCERVFSPWTDMEKELRENDVKLYSLESRTPLNAFDVVGFSLSYELTYSNVLNMMDMAGITIFSEDRGDDEPIVIAGGTCCFNPEPMSRFIDIFFIGDAEESLPRFLQEYSIVKNKKIPRLQKLKILSSLPGLYVPALYEQRTDDPESGVNPVCEEVPVAVTKNTVQDLDNAFYPVKQIVPLVKTVHDRIAVEIMRGCPNRCRFCQAGAVNKPVRLRKPNTIKRICNETYKNTGYSQISLLSLSSVNYPYILPLVKELNSEFSSRGVSLSIPSLRVEESFYDLPEIISMVKKTGLTFAPETAHKGIQEAISKNTEYEVFCRSAEKAFSYGWNRLKLYFMVGFPVDISNEVESLVKWAGDISMLRKKYSRRQAEIKISVNPFIPKAHTPLQWIGMRSLEELENARIQLKRSSNKNLKIEFHDTSRSILEAALSRGNRTTSMAVYYAWQMGARLDGWFECFDYSVWEKAFSRAGLDLKGEAVKRYDISSELPWGHIKGTMGDDFLIDEFKATGF